MKFCFFVINNKTFILSLTKNKYCLIVKFIKQEPILNFINRFIDKINNIY